MCYFTCCSEGHSIHSFTLNTQLYWHLPIRFEWVHSCWCVYTVPVPYLPLSIHFSSFYFSFTQIAWVLFKVFQVLSIVIIYSRCCSMFRPQFLWSFLRKYLSSIVVQKWKLNYKCKHTQKYKNIYFQIGPRLYPMSLAQTTLMVELEIWTHSSCSLSAI